MACEMSASEGECAVVSQPAIEGVVEPGLGRLFRRRRSRESVGVRVGKTVDMAEV